MSGEDVQVDDWVVHRPNVVRSVAARVPGIDAEEAASRALEKMVRIVSSGGTIEDPAPYWRRAAVNEAVSMTREAGRTRPVEGDTLAALTPPVEGAELDAEREADVSMLRSALSDLADDDRKILLNRHVHDMAVTDIAGDLGVRPHAVTMRLRRAEERLAGAFAAAHAQNVNEPECRTTRAAMHDYLKGRLLPRRQRRLEVHMDGCGECTRAFIDVREVSWMLRDLGQHLIAGGLASGAVGTATVGTAGVGTAGVGGSLGSTRPRSFGTKHAAVAAGVLAVLVLGAGAAALIAGLPASMSIQAVGEPPPAGGSDAPATTPPHDPAPPQTSTGPADPPRTPRPAAEKSHPPPAAGPVTAPVAAVEPAAATKPHARPKPDSRPEPPRATPAQEKPKPAKPKPAKPDPGPKPEKPPASGPPDKGQTGGPPGNPGNDHGKGHGKGNGHDKGPGHDKGHGNGHGKGPRHGHGSGQGQGPGSGNGNGSGQGNGHGAGHGNGKGSGHGSGKSQGPGSGPGKDKSSGKGHGNGKGQGADKGHGHGNGKGPGHGKGAGSPRR